MRKKEVSLVSFMSTFGTLGVPVMAGFGTYFLYFMGTGWVWVSMIAGLTVSALVSQYFNIFKGERK